MGKRVYNFSPGPAILPVKVLDEAAAAVRELAGTGASILEISHRSKAYDAVSDEAKALVVELLGIPSGYRVLFLQGGASLQFTMVPMNLLCGRTADYVVTGSWGGKALAEAARQGSARAAWDGKTEHYSRLPRADEPKFSADAAYVHITANETIQGVEFASEPDTGPLPLVCDASSSFLSRPVDVSRYGLIYACAQKNAGIAGATVVVIRDDLVQRVPKNLAPMLDYRLQAENDSHYNTPPVFGVYVLLLVARWLTHEVGGLERMAEINGEKARLLYDVLDRYPDFYRGHADPESRSKMNVTFRLASEALEGKFLAEAKARDLVELKGHRSVGGIRASIYNAMPREGVAALRDFMLEFHEKNAS
jgi:phosphoserine aminotransferase